MKSKDLFNTDDHNTYMMLGLLNALTNAGVLPKKERDDILRLGEVIKGNAVSKENNEQIKVAREMAKQLQQLGSDYFVTVSTPTKTLKG